MNTREFLALVQMKPEEQDAKRLRQITALQEAGVATWDEHQEANQIRRRQVIRSLSTQG